LHELIVEILFDLFSKQIKNIENLIEMKSPEAFLVNEFNCHSHFRKVGDVGIEIFKYASGKQVNPLLVSEMHVIMKLSIC
jgi:hypothetical protein